jgi:hypothetical protein
MSLEDFGSIKHIQLLRNVIRSKKSNYVIRWFSICLLLNTEIIKDKWNKNIFKYKLKDNTQITDKYNLIKSFDLIHKIMHLYLKNESNLIILNTNLDLTKSSRKAYGIKQKNSKIKKESGKLSIQNRYNQVKN